jgi:hypothetical protein
MNRRRRQARKFILLIADRQKMGFFQPTTVFVDFTSERYKITDPRRSEMSRTPMA